MPLSSSLTASLSKIADLNEDNWGKWSKDFIMFFRGCSATWITAATATSGVPDDKKGLDGELVWAIYSHVSETFQPLIQDATSGLEAWRLLKKRFEKSTMARRIKARSDFYHAAHDPHLPIDIYINKVTACRGILKGLGCEPSDTETADVLLMNLHPSWSGVRTSITSNKDEQSLDDVKAILNGSSVDPPAKDEDVDTPLAFAASNARFGSGGRKGGAGGGNGYNGGGASGRNGYNGGGAGGGNGYNGSGGGQSNDGTCHDEHVSDDKGYRWCDPTNENHCHRCGRTGHIAARCIHDMPQHIKDWVMNPRTRANMATMEHANNNYVLGYDFNLDVGSDSDDEHAPKYSNGVQIPLRI